MGTRYIGSKARVVDDLLDLIGPPGPGEPGRFIDAFSGTGVVAARAADLGWAVVVNDTLLSSSISSRARLFAEADVPFEALGGYEVAVKHLNAVDPVDGFLSSEYSPAGSTDRKYFTAVNARRIDAARALIGEWDRGGLISQAEFDLLVADVIFAANAVANIAGTYGCYLSRWSATALKDFEVVARDLRRVSVEHARLVGDAATIPVTERDVLYFDPPYTKRQYAAYYHIPESIAHGDAPSVGGKTGLRPWKHLASRFCYSRRAHQALVDLLRAAGAHRIYLSYSNEGHIDLDDLLEDLSPIGQVTLHSLADIGRYRPNRAAVAAADSVTEYVVQVDKDPVSRAGGA